LLAIQFALKNEYKSRLQQGLKRPAHRIIEKNLTVFTMLRLITALLLLASLAAGESNDTCSKPILSRLLQ